VDLLAAWLLYPLAVGAICLGLGLLVERLADWRMPGPLLFGVGLGTLLALARLITFKPQTAELALPIVGVLVIAGLVLGRARLRALRPDPWIAGAALGVFVIYAAPIVLSGEPSFAGYLALPDTAHQLSLANLFANHGPDYAALPDSANRLSMLAYVIAHYPVSGQAALGITGPLGVLDIAWLYQPFLTIMAVALCLGIAALVDPLLPHRWQVAITAFVAAQSALVLGFALQGSIKEIAVVAMLVVAAAVTAAAVRQQRPARSLLALAPVVAAALGALGPAALPYLAVVALAVLVLWGAKVVRERERRRSELLWLGATAALAAVLAFPVLESLREAISINSDTLDATSGAAGGGDASAALGHLAGPLEMRQALGIWLAGDFRYGISQNHSLQDALSIVALIAAVLGLLWAARRRAWGPLLLLTIVGPPSIYLLSRGNAYADAKVLMIVSPVLLALSMLGAVSLWTGRWRAVSLAVTGFLVLGVLGSSAYAYRDVSLAPHDRFDELLSLNERLDGNGPVVVTEYDEFTKYFLRDATPYAQPESPHGYRIEGPGKQPTLFNLERRPSLKTPLDLDDLTLEYLESVPYLIVRRSPVASRPPSSFRLAKRGEYYDLWQRRPGPRILRHKPLGPDILHPAQRVDRATARSWGRQAQRLGGRIAFAPRSRASLLLPSKVPHQWPDYLLYPGAVVTAFPSRVANTMRVQRSGRYHLWLEGSFGRSLDVAVDGRRVARTQPGLNNPGAYQALATLTLTRGVHQVEISQGVGDRTEPGNGGYRSSLRHIGPIVLHPVADERGTVNEIEPRQWRSLVGREIDWLEIVSR